MSHALNPIDNPPPRGTMIARARMMIGRVGLDAIALGCDTVVEILTSLRNKVHLPTRVEDLESGGAWLGPVTGTESADMDAILPQLLSFPPHPPPVTPLPDADYDKQIKLLVQLLNKTPANQLTAGVSGGGDLLDILNPSINSLPFLYVLLAHINGPQGGKQVMGSQASRLVPDGALWAKVEDFTERFDPVQIRYAGNLFTRLINKIAKAARTALKPHLAIPLIRSAILRLDPSSSTFTSSHLVFVHLCLVAREFRAALPVLDNDIFHFPPLSENASANSINQLPCSEPETSSTFITVPSGLTEKLDYRHHLQYFLFGAMLYMGLKNWERAQQFLGLVIISPTNSAPSMIQVHAYKKWALVNLLHEGRPLPMPKTTNGHDAKIYRGIAKAYDNLAEVFSDGISKETTADKLKAEVDAGQAVWQDDGNMGLVFQVVDAFRRFSILKLGQTYTALTIADVAERTSDNPNDYDETAQHLMSLISAGQLNATITQAGDVRNWVLRFATSSTTGPLARTEEQVNEEITKQFARTTALTNHVKELDRKLGLSKEYNDWTKKAQRSKELSPNGDLEPSHSHGLDEYGPDDEDMMGDL